jgi:hypothetical protein
MLHRARDPLVANAFDQPLTGVAPTETAPLGQVVSKGHSMTLLIILLLLALVFGGIGLFVEAAAWALIIAVVLLIAGAIAGVVGRGRSTA